MQTFLIVVAAVVVGLLIVVAIVFFWLKLKLKKLARGITAAVGALQGGVPPFRISLEPVEGHSWSAADALGSVTRALESCGYVPADDYAIPEMEGVHVRGLAHSGVNAVAAVYEHPQAGLVVDLVRLHTDRVNVLVSNGPESGLEEPPNKIVHRTNVNLGNQDEVNEAILRMHEKLLQLSAGHQPVQVVRRLFPMIFTTAYAAEMDWRIKRGGVSAEEVRGAAAAGGQEPPDDSAVELVRMGWQHAIDEHISGEVRQAFMAQASDSRPQPGTLNGQLLVVHEHSMPDSLAEELVGLVMSDDDDEEQELDETEEDALDALETRIRAAFEGCSVSEGFERAMAMMPAHKQVRALGKVVRPWPATLYAMPVA